ncbi:MAG TPA: AI-2E family transporter [Anaerolineales bacterium]|nr:AI-2E family transporter [Anaerolineales bacterium]
MNAQPVRARWSNTVKLMVGGSLLALGVYVVFRFSALIIPLIIAFILAYVLSPLVSLVQTRLRLSRGWSTGIVYLLALGVISIVPILVVPALLEQLRRLNLDFQRIILSIETFLRRPVVIGSLRIDVSELVIQAESSLRGILEPLFSQTLNFAVDVLTSLVWTVFILVVSFYLVKDGAHLTEWIENLFPPDLRQDVRRLRGEVNPIWSAFFRGQLVLVLVVACIITVGGLVVGLPFALAMGVLAGLLEFLPSLGHGIWLVIAALLTLFRGSTWIPLPNWIVAFIVIGLHGVFQQVDLNLLIPSIIGRRVRLHPLVVILGIVAGASLAGVLGIFLAAPTIASMRVVGRYLQAKLFEMEPPPAELAPELARD